MGSVLVGPDDLAVGPRSQRPETFVSTVSLMNRAEPSQSRKWNVPSTNETSRPKEFRAALAQQRHEQEGHDPEDEPGT